MSELELYERQLLEDATREMARAMHNPMLKIVVCRGDSGEDAELMVPVTAMALLGHLQLALSHPANHGPSAERMRQLARKIEAKLAELGPAVARICAIGWDRKFDV